MASHIRAKEMCMVCSKIVSASSHHISCDICHKLTHFQCISSTMSHYVVLKNSVYYCSNCVASNLPLNHMTNNDEFINSVSYFSSDYPLVFKHANISNAVHCLNAYRDNTLTSSDDIDPDVNMYNTLCPDVKYYLPNELNETIIHKHFWGHCQCCT